jgi:hypothetical protein
MDSGRSTRALPRVGFPIRKSSDQRMVSSFPRLIAAAHVLHRLLAPRHPPCALVLLIRKNTFYCRYGVFKVRVDRSSTRRSATRSWSRAGGLSKLNSVTNSDRRLNEGGQQQSRVEVDVVPGEPDCPDGPRAIDGSDAYRSKSSGIP